MCVGATEGAATLTYVCWLPLLHSVRLVSLAAEKFVEDVGKDVKECAVDVGHSCRSCRYLSHMLVLPVYRVRLIVLRGEKAQDKRQAGKTKQVLTAEDLTQALSAAHPPVRVAKPPYHT